MVERGARPETAGLEPFVYPRRRARSNRRMVSGVSAMSARSELLRKQILELVAAYHDEAFGGREFVPGESPVPVSGRVFDAADVQALVDSGLDFWLTAGRFAAQFEKKFAEFFGVRGASLVNSGASSNLLALTALTSPRLEHRSLNQGMRGLPWR